MRNIIASMDMRYKEKVTLFLVSLIILFPQIISTVSSEQHNQYISDRVKDMYSFVRTSSLSSWDKVRSLVNHVQKQYFPPNLEPRDEGHPKSGDDDGAKRMQEAVGKSFGASKAAVEETAKSAAEVVGEAVHKTAEKMKDCTGNGCHTEL